MRHRSGAVPALVAVALIAGLAVGPAAGAATSGGDLSMTVSGLRNTKGQILVCLTTAPKAFPDCSRDPASRHLKVPANAAARLDFGPVPAGTYAISLIHDENGNGKLDTMMGIPREGYGFSRDAPVRFGPPKFAAAAFATGAGAETQPVKVRYIF